MEREAKRNAECNAERDRLQQAFTAEDPAPLLLDILKKDPTYRVLYATISTQSETILIVHKLSHSPLSGSSILQMHLPSEEAHSEETHSKNSSISSWGVTLQVVRRDEGIRCRVWTMDPTTLNSSTRFYRAFRLNSTYLAHQE